MSFISIIYHERIPTRSTLLSKHIEAYNTFIPAALFLLLSSEISRKWVYGTPFSIGSAGNGTFACRPSRCWKDISCKFHCCGYSEDMIPTVGFNMKKVTKGNVTIKLWDLGGQRRFRTMWERYCRGVTAILYVVDAADWDSIPITKTELHDLLMKPSLNGIPLLVLGNKIDKSQALTKQALVDQLGLDTIKDREVCCYMISCKESININMVIDWLIKHSKTAT